MGDGGRKGGQEVIYPHFHGTAKSEPLEEWSQPEGKCLSNFTFTTWRTMEVMEEQLGFDEEPQTNSFPYFTTTIRVDAKLK